MATAVCMQNTPKIIVSFSHYRFLLQKHCFMVTNVIFLFNLSFGGVS